MLALVLARRAARGVRLLGLALLKLLQPRPYLDAFREVAALLRRNRLLTVEMAKRDIRGEHSGQILGAAWGIGQPVFLLALYAFIFGVVFRVRIDDSLELPRNFTVYLLAGIVPWFAFLHAMSKGTTAITESAHLVKQAIFELEIIPVTRALAACLPLVVGVGFITLYLLAAYQELPPTYLLVPVLVASQLIAMAGVAFMLSSIGAFVRDVKEIIQMLVLMGIFVLPIVYLPDSAPGPLRPLLYANPFSYMTWCYQDAIYFGRIEHPASWVIFLAGSLFVFVAGYRLFRKLKPHFANVV